MFVTDTSNPYNWTQLYEEMFYAAYDTTQYQHIDDLLVQRQVHAANDTVQIATMDWSYNLLTRDALTTPNYFVFDTVNNLLYDLPNRPNSPYLWRNVFAGSTLELASTSLTTTFKLGPSGKPTPFFFPSKNS